MKLLYGQSAAHWRPEGEDHGRYRNGIKTVFLPAEQCAGSGGDRPHRPGPPLHFVPVEQVDSVLAEALELKTCDPLRDDALPPLSPAPGAGKYPPSDSEELT